MGKPAKQNKAEHWTKMLRHTMQEPAWQALSVTAQALYPWLKFEWHGPNSNNNGRVRLSVRQAAERLGVGINTAAKAYHELQAKGFIVVTEPAYLGSSGEAKSPAYELTELPLPQSTGPEGRKLFREWKSERQFPVQKVPANNPRGVNKKIKARHQNEDILILPRGVPEFPTKQQLLSLQNWKGQTCARHALAVLPHGSHAQKPFSF